MGLSSSSSIKEAANVGAIFTAEFLFYAGCDLKGLNASSLDFSSPRVGEACFRGAVCIDERSALYCMVVQVIGYGRWKPDGLIVCNVKLGV